MRSVFLAFCRGVCYNIGNIPGDRKNRGVITDEKYKIAALLMIIHGGFMEIGGVLCMIPALLLGTDKFDIGQYFSFKLSYFQENLSLMIVMGAMYGVLRLIGAIGLLKNRMSNNRPPLYDPYSVIAGITVIEPQVQGVKKS